MKVTKGDLDLTIREKLQGIVKQIMFAVCGELPTDRNTIVSAINDDCHTQVRDALNEYYSCFLGAGEELEILITSEELADILMGK